MNNRDLESIKRQIDGAETFASLAMPTLISWIKTLITKIIYITINFIIASSALHIIFFQTITFYKHFPVELSLFY